MRVSSKAFVLDPDGRLLLLDSADPGQPGLRWWELPGGGVEPGETPADAAVREVLEETGVRLPPGALGPLQWTQTCSYSFRGARHASACEGRLARLTEPPTPVPVVLTRAEVDNVLGLRWWTPAELAASTERFFPRDVPALLPRLLAGEVVHQGPDDWDLT